eukprot:g4074.t1
MDGGPPQVTFEDLAIDDTLSDLERVVRYSRSNIALQRLVHVRVLTETAEAVGFERANEELVPLLSHLSTDPEFIIRQAVAEQAGLMAGFCCREGGEDGYHVVIFQILPLLQYTITEAEQDEVRVAARDALVTVAGLVREADLGAHVLTVVLGLAHNEEQEELRMMAAVLLNELASLLGEALCHQFVTPEVLNLSDDGVFRVRKAVALNLRHVFKTTSDEVTLERLLPAFLRLSADDIWGVRKACAESLVAVSEVVSAEIRRDALLPLVEAFLSDPSKWVKQAARQALGPFLSTIAPADSLSPEAVGLFTNLPFAAAEEGAAASSTTVACAFSFPGVLLAMGSARWGELAGLHAKLSRSEEWRVRRTLAFSLHEVARIIGPANAEASLVGTFDLFIGDVDEVKVGVLTHLGK